MQQGYKRLSIEFPSDEYIYLKLACAKQGISIKDFVTKAVLKTIEEYEEHLDIMAFKEAYTEENIANAVTWEKVKKELSQHNQA